MTIELTDILDALHAMGYGSITRTEEYPEASGEVLVPKKYRRDPRTGWRRLLPRVYDGGEPALVPDDLRATVEDYGWTVQPMGRNATMVTIVVSENGV
jgi:hypothetical protein